MPKSAPSKLSCASARKCCGRPRWSADRSSPHSDAADSAERARDRSQSIDRDGRRKSVLRRARLWIPVALAAAAMFAFVMLRGGATPAHAVPPFDVAIENYSQFAAHFEPNIKSNSPADISDAYMGNHLPGILMELAAERLQTGRRARRSSARRKAGCVHVLSRRYRHHLMHVHGSAWF